MPGSHDSDVSVSETGAYTRLDDAGPSDDTGAMAVESTLDRGATPPPQPRASSGTGATNVPLPNLRGQIQAPPPPEKKRIPLWIPLAAVGAGLFMLLLVTVLGVWLATRSTGDDGAIDPEEQRRQQEEELGVPVRDGLRSR